MAGNYIVLSSETVPVTLSNGDSVNGFDSTLQAVPSAVVWHAVIVVNDATFNDPSQLAAAVDAVASPYADYFNQDVQVTGVVALSTFQDVDTLNNIVSKLSVTVQSDDGNQQITREAPLTDAIPDRFAALVAETRASLNTLAAA